MLYIQSMAGFENFRPEENWQCIDRDTFELWNFFTVVLPKTSCESYESVHLLPSLSPSPPTTRPTVKHDLSVSHYFNPMVQCLA